MQCVGHWEDLLSGKTHLFLFLSLIHSKTAANMATMPMMKKAATTPLKILTVGSPVSFTIAIVVESIGIGVDVAGDLELLVVCPWCVTNISVDYTAIIIICL